MSMFTVFDATRVAGRMVDVSDDDRWVLARADARPPRPAATVAPPYSWWGLARNPNALLLTGMVTAAVVRDAVRGALT